MTTTAAVIGAGQRGHFVYGDYALNHPKDLRFTAVVDPDSERRDRFRARHPSAVPFASVDEWLAAGRLADIAVIASPDRFHHHAAVGALRAGYAVLLEKPMAGTLAEAIDVVRVAAETGRTMAVSHVLRYTPFFATLNRVLASGRLGQIVTVEHRENVWAFHMAHSFVRGNWSKAAESTPMIVQKCCHDFDILTWNLPSPVKRLSSIGSLQHFVPGQAPPGATHRCTDPCPVERCPFDARRYLNPAWQGWPVSVVTDDLSQEARLRALETGPYGRCVYVAESDVVDHQVVTMELQSGTSVVLVMHGHSGEEGRTMRYDGSAATLRARFGVDSLIEVTDHHTGVTESIPLQQSVGGHGGGDVGIVGSFLAAVQSGQTPITSAAESLESHLLAFAAEEARLHGGVIDMATFRASAMDDDPPTAS